MNIRACCVEPGLGLGAVYFGMQKHQVALIMGPPDKESTNAFGQTDWHYDDHYYPTVAESILILSFEEEEQDRLTHIALDVISDELMLFGCKVATLSLEDIAGLLSVNQGGVIKLERPSWTKDPTILVMVCESLSLRLVFRRQKLERVLMTPLFADEDNYKWPVSFSTGQNIQQINPADS